MTFEDWLRTQIEARAEISVRLGMAGDQSHASIMTWSDKTAGTHFWKVEGDHVSHLQFIGEEP
jgi:hypothetical protein